MAHAALAPSRAVSDAAHFVFRNPWNPLSITALGRNISAGAELFERMTRRYGKPTFGLDEIEVDGVVHPILEDVVWSRPFCNLLRFVRPEFPGGDEQPKLLIVAPMSGHYPTLLRGTVEAFLPHCDVYITDWADARMVPLAAGTFDLDDYIDYLRAMLDHLGPGVHTLGICQPSVPLLAAVALMEANDDPNAPASMTLMGGPIDTRRSPTEVNKLAERRGVEWFRRNCLHRVPFPYPGFGREVYPGFLQLSGFMAMNLDRHVNAHLDMFNHLVRGDGDSAEKHREFYDEYLAVMDLDADYYIADGRNRFHSSRSAEGRDETPRPARRSDGDPQLRPDDRRRREGRYFRGRPDLCRAGTLRQYPRREEGASPGEGSWPLRRVQRLPLPQGNCAAHPQIHCDDRREAGDAQRPPQTRCEVRDRRGLETNGTRRSRPAFSAANTAKRPSTTAGRLNLRSGGGIARCLTGKLSTETISIGTGLLGAFQAKKTPLGRRETCSSTGALNYIELKGPTARPCPKK